MPNKQPKTNAKRSAPQRAFRQHYHFLAAWLRSPLKVGAVMPSSRALTRAMAAQLDVSAPGMVIELGAGTGVVTQALLEAGVPPERLLVIERDPKLHAMLTAQFHNLKVVCADAAMLDDLLAAHQITEVNSVVSSLPLVSIPEHTRYAIEEAMAKAIGKNGLIVQFTYAPRSPLRRSLLRQQYLKARRVKTILANVPPAHVWVYRR